MANELENTDGIDELEGAAGTDIEGAAGLEDTEDMGADTESSAASLSNAQQELVKDNVKLAYFLASRYAGSGATQTELEDLTSVAILQLVKCAAKYDPARGIPFSGYAGTSIRGALQTAKAKVSKNDYLFPASMDEPIGAGDEDDDESSRHDVAGDGKNPLGPLLSKENAAELRKVVDTLPEREKAVLLGLYWDDLPANRLGAKLGVSGVYIAKVHANALKLLSKRLAKRGIEPMRESAIAPCSAGELREEFTAFVAAAFPRR
jgi:RNA polymerase sigma factor (sigma-70 family)